MLPVATGVYRRNPTLPITQAIEAAQEWMSSCLGKHERCEKHTQPRTYPTRLLELGGHNFRLILPQEENPSGPYAALSYCWGPNPSFIRLTADNLQNFRVGQPYTSLPIAFQEAIHIIQKLGIQYLWIDALDYFAEALYEQPIGSRAWVMQERLLATRVLSIGHGELFWDCQQIPHASESLPYGFTLCSDQIRSYLRAANGLSIPSVPQTSNSEHVEGNCSISNSEDLEDIWSKIIKEYNARQLTYPQTDKLMALSAISKRIGYAMDDTYLGGHFSKTLPISLNWYTERRKPPILCARDRVQKRLPKSPNPICDGNWINNPSWNWFIIPSWSWASVDGRLETVHIVGKYLTSLAVMEMYEFSPTSRTGQENELLLTIRTWCRIIEWSNFRLDIDLGLLFVTDGPHDLDFTLDDMDDIPDDGSQCVLAALSHRFCPDFQAINGLLLREIDFDGKKVYERMGHFAWYFWDTDEDVGEDVGEDLETYFPHGKRSITLC
ncbi:unnamed protein product [Alternaria alternata]